MKKKANSHLIGVWDFKSQYQKDGEDNTFDVKLAEYLLSYGKSIKTQEEVLQTYNVTSLDEVVEKQQEAFETLPKLSKLYHDIERPLVSVLADMEKHGIRLDVEKLRGVGEELKIAISEIEGKIKAEVGFDINLNSSIQVGNFLAEKLYVPLPKTKTGRYATSEPELVQFSDQFPIIKDIVTYRELTKLLSTYVESLIGKVDGNSRIHTTYHQVAVNTGRLASSNPNMQNIPVTSEFGRKIKSCFVAEEGYTFLSFDYSQQELRILAHLSGEEKLIDAFKNNRDVHITTASQVFGVSYDSVTQAQRSAAKTINFGIIYGMSKFGLSQQLNITQEDAQTFIDAFFANYPKIKSYYDSYLLEGKKRGYIETLLGRRRPVFDYPAPSFAKGYGRAGKFIDNNLRRVLINYPIQGSAADLMKMAMVQIKKQILDKDPSIKMLLQIHDDLVFEVPDKKEKVDELIKNVKEIMCNVYPLSVPVEVDVKIGKNWGEMELITTN